MTNKTFITLALTLCGAMPLLADGTQQSLRFGDAGTPVQNYGPSGTADTGWMPPTSFSAGAAIWLTPEQRQLFSGSSISKLTFYHGSIMDNSVTDLTIFVREGLNGNDEFSSRMTFSERGAEEMVFDFSEPILITPGEEELVVGWSVDIADNTGQYSNIWAVDRNTGLPSYNNDAIRKKDGQWVRENMNWMFGNCCIWLDITGESFPMDRLGIYDLSIPLYINPGKEFSYRFVIRNTGFNDVTSMKIGSCLGNNPTLEQTVEFATPLSGGQVSECILKATYPEAGIVPVNISLLEVNAADCTTAEDNSLFEYVVSSHVGDGYARNVLIEEAGGTWCEHCPRGIVGMQSMSEAYADDGRLVLVSVHENDPMEIDTYKDFLHNFISEYPLGIVDRMEAVNPLFENLQQCYLSHLELPAYARLTLEAAVDEDAGTVELRTDANFFFDDFGERYRIVYVAVEDNVGPYPQKNSYAGGETPMGGFETLEEITPVVFDDVAICSTEAMGIAGVYPDRIDAGRSYTHSEILTLPKDCKIDDCRFVAYLVNSRTNAIENVTQAKAQKNSITIPACGEDNVSPAKYYNLQGEPVNADTAVPGVYIRLDRSGSSKVFLR